MATTYELSFFETDTGLAGTTFIYGFDALTSGDVKAIGYSGATKTDITSTIATVNTTTKTLTFTTAPSAYTKIRIYRSTTVLSLVDFTSGAVLSEDALNTAYRHSLFAAQEVSQDAGDSANRSIIFTADINTGAVTTDNVILDEHINAGAVTNAKLATNAVTAVKIASDSVTTSKILDANVTAAKLAATLDLSSKTLTLPAINNPFSKQLLYVVEEFATNTAGGSALATTQNIRALNTVIENGITGASFNAGTYQVTLPAGKYLFDYAAPALRTNGHFAMIYQVSVGCISVDNNPAGIIGNGNSAHSASTDNSVTVSSGTNVVTLVASSTVIELRHYTVAAQATTGLGIAVNLAGRLERYAGLKIWKLS